ncbi:uncharacterized protein L201_001188 [Kwoniella dendrophila CBS 6074]|uniref:Uncharacterized protein n=1 Tax=Kwoniella dendrophila CBS 6074 TaxID=1295534 RepID=A0AAX4JP26_9TREE
MSSNTLWIPDSSPLFFYSPAEAYFAGQNFNAWIGNDGIQNNPNENGKINQTVKTTSFHRSSGNTAIILPSIYATSFTPIFQASPTEYNVTFQLASWPPEPWESGKTYQKSNEEKYFDPQTFTLNFWCLKENQSQCTGEIDFLGAFVETKFAPDKSQIEIVDLDDSSPLIQYEGFSPVNQDNKIVNIDADTDNEKTLSMTSTEGSKATVSFTGASVQIYGVTCTQCGNYSIALDESSSTFNSFNNATIHDSLLYFTTNLDTSKTHTLTLEAKGGVVLDKFVAQGPKGGVGFIGNIDGKSTTVVGPSSNSVPTGNRNSTGIDGSNQPLANGNGDGIQPTSGGSPNAGVIVGAILGTLAGLGFLYFLCLKVSPKLKKDKEKKLNPWDEANLLQNMKNEEVHVTTAANQRYVYPGLIAHSDLKKK